MCFCLTAQVSLRKYTPSATSNTCRIGLDSRTHKQRLRARGKSKIRLEFIQSKMPEINCNRQTDGNEFMSSRESSGAHKHSHCLCLSFYARLCVYVCVCVFLPLQILISSEFIFAFFFFS